jgi:NADH-quinone oxidoreductase subunit J
MVFAILVIASRNPIHSIGALIGIVLNFVFLLISLEAEYLALTFVAVYLGAVTVLFLFIVMMLNIKGVNYNKELIYSLPVGIVLGLVFVSLIIFSFFGYIDNSAVIEYFNPLYYNWYSIFTKISDIEVFGSILYSDYAPCLLIVGVVLLIAMVGAVVLTKVNYINVKKMDFIDQQVARSPNNAVFLVNEKK